MKTVTIKLKEKREIARDTMEFLFDRPKNFDYKAGQYCLFTLIDPLYTDMKGSTRPMSLASAPHEDYVSMAMRMSDSAFKRSLMDMELGTEVEMQGPMGHIVLDEDDDPSQQIVFLAGGIGIVPFRAMLEEAKKNDYPRQMTLIYSNHTPEDISYYQELSEHNHKNIKVINTITSPNEVFNWGEEEGFINAEMLRKHVPQHREALYYIVGVPAMVQAMQDMLDKEKIPFENVRVELFGGY